MIDAGTASAGALLRAAREKQGLHIAALAAAIKVSPRKLDALENDRLDELPDATFARALAQTVCRSLKIDARPVLDLLPAANTAALETGKGGLNTPFHDRPGRDEPGLSGMPIRPMIWAAAVLMLAAVVVVLLPEGLLSGWTSSPAPAVAEPVVVPAVAATVLAPAPAPAASVEMPAAVLAAAASAPAAITSSAPAVAATAPAAAPVAGGETVFSAPAGAADAAAPAGVVQLRTSDASWIEARDGRGQVLLSRTVLPGESVGLDGSLPIRLIIGNAAVTQLGFRGRPVDLAQRTRDNVARVELQ